VRAHVRNGRTVLQLARRMPPETRFLSMNTNEAKPKVRDGLLDFRTKTGDTPRGL